MVCFAKSDRKIDVIRPHLERLGTRQPRRMTAIGVAQEVQRVFTGITHHPDDGGARLPLLLFNADRSTGYWWGLSMRQIEVYRTLVSDTPCHPRVFDEVLCTDNVGIGRSEEIATTFGQRVRTPPTGGYRTRLLRLGDEVTTSNALFRRSRVESYLKDQRAFRIEMVINDTGDLGVARRLEHPDNAFS